MMYSAPENLTKSREWQDLEQHRDQLRSQPMKELFARDSTRADRYFIEGAGLSLDFSKNRLNDETLKALMALARYSGLENKRAALLRGDAINTTEGRPALHTALRLPSDATISVNGKNVVAEVHTTLARMEQLVTGITEQTITGHTGKPFTDIVSIGIGGSFLGPKLVCEALQPFQRDDIRCHFVANIDGSDICETLRQVNPETTLFLVQSKSFRTEETLENSRVARQWFVDRCGDESAVAKHFIAVTANVDAARDFGIDESQVYPMWDWVGGRYSLWSAIGLPIALTVGMPNFRALLAGAHAMDQHFANAPLEENLPVVMAMLSLWYNNFWQADTHAIAPYDHYLRSLPDYLQQLDMESNGKSVDLQGRPTPTNTGTIIWGGIESNGQHAYHQLFHQGTRLIPVDFIIPLHTHNKIASHHAHLFSNCLAQSQAMMAGKSLEEVRSELAAEGLNAHEIDRLAPHKVIPGNKPSNTLIMDKLTPETLGALIALYEHRTFVQGVVWGINPFDQWGVELGKQLGAKILAQLTSGDNAQSDSDASTGHLVRLFRSAHGA